MTRSNTAMESTGAIEKAIDVLFHLHSESGPRGVTAIGRALGLPKSSAHRLLAALGRRGLVEQDARGRYRPGIGLIALGLGALEREPVVAAARRVLEEEAAALGETFFLVAARAQQLVILDKAEGTGFLRAAPQVGATVPVHATAVGKVFLAFGADAVSEPAEPFEGFAARTRTTVRALQDEVARTRQWGYAENREEWIPGLAVLAAPVFGGDRLLAAVAVALPATRYAAIGRSELARHTMAAAQRVSARMDGSGQ
jgi:DNA-binding IclR family transcriptional regulator